MRSVKDQHILEILDTPLAQIRECRVARFERSAHLRLCEQIAEGLLSASEEAIGSLKPGVFSQINEVLDEIAPCRRAFENGRHGYRA